MTKEGHIFSGLRTSKNWFMAIFFALLFGQAQHGLQEGPSVILLEVDVITGVERRPLLENYIPRRLLIPK